MAAAIRDGEITTEEVTEEAASRFADDVGRGDGPDRMLTQPHDDDYIFAV